jgi:hypothetical protein
VIEQSDLRKLVVAVDVYLEETKEFRLLRLRQWDFSSILVQVLPGEAAFGIRSAPISIRTDLGSYLTHNGTSLSELAYFELPNDVYSTAQFIRDIDLEGRWFYPTRDVTSRVSDSRGG